MVMGQNGIEKEKHKVKLQNETHCWQYKLGPRGILFLLVDNNQYEKGTFYFEETIPTIHIIRLQLLLRWFHILSKV